MGGRRGREEREPGRTMTRRRAWRPQWAMYLAWGWCGWAWEWAEAERVRRIMSPRREMVTMLFLALARASEVISLQVAVGGVKRRREASILRSSWRWEVMRTGGRPAMSLKKASWARLFSQSRRFSLISQRAFSMAVMAAVMWAWSAQALGVCLRISFSSSVTDPSRCTGRTNMSSIDCR